MLSLMLGIDIPIPELQLTIHQPRIKDIAYMSEDEFFVAMQYLSLDKHMFAPDKTDLDNITNFQILMKVLEQMKDKSKKTALITLLSILFPDYKALITPQSIILMNIEDSKNTVIIDDKNFNVFQDMIKKVLCVSSIFQGQNVVYNPQGEKAKAIAEKIYEGRRKVAAAKASEGEGQSSIFTRYVSILATGLKLTPDQIGDYTMFQLFDQMERFNLKTEWDIDLKVRLTGTTPKTQVKNWMDDIHSTN